MHFSKHTFQKSKLNVMRVRTHLPVSARVQVVVLTHSRFVVM